MLRRLRIAPPKLPIVANVDGEFYPTGDGAEEQIVDILGRQVASPVQFVKGLRTLYDAGARVFVETGPKRALHGFAADVLGDDEALNLLTNHPKQGDLVSFNQALCGLYAAGLGAGAAAPAAGEAPAAQAVVAPAAAEAPAAAAAPPAAEGDRLRQLGAIFADVLERGRALLGQPGDDCAARPARRGARGHHRRGARPPGRRAHLRRRQPGADPARRAAHRRHPVRPATGDARPPHHAAGQGRRRVRGLRDHRRRSRRHQARRARGRVRPGGGVRRRRRPAGRARALDPTGDRRGHRRAARRRHPARPALQARRRKGTQLPDRWVLPEALRDDTGVIFASAFPGLEEFGGRSAPLLGGPGPPRAACRPGGGARARPRERHRRAHGDRAADPRPATRARPSTVRIRPPLPVPRAVDGPLAVRRVDRRPRSEHAGQRGVREHDAGGRGRRGLDPRRALPPGGHRRRRRRDVRRAAAVDRRGLPGVRRGRDRRDGRRRGAALRPPPSRNDARDGRGRRSSSRARTRPASAA